MLKSLYIENLAVISRADIELQKGLNVFTGETGAGKTVLIGAISAVLGQRMPKDLIRTGETRAQVSAVFTDLSDTAQKLLDEYGYELDEDGSLLITRVIRPDSTECRVGGRPATAAVLRALGGELIDLHGQHDNTRLLSPEYHLSLVDQFAGTAEKLASYGESWKTLTRLRAELKKCSMDEGERARRIDLLQYQVQEIEEADPAPGEEEELSAQRRLMRNASRVAEALGEAKELLSPEYGEQAGVEDQFSSLAAAVSEAARFIPELEAAAGRLTDITYELEELGRDLADYQESVDFSPRQLDAVEERLSLLHTLKTKYGPDIEAVLAYAKKARAELEALMDTDNRRERLQKAVQAAQAEAQKKADELSALREKAAGELAAAVEGELRDLEMPGVRLSVRRERQALGPLGQDSMELLISPNPGEPPKPLHKIASGGEISRVMLSLKNVLTSARAHVASIFDEVDTGVSGRAADKIGRKLAEVSRYRQVLCVTHLAQVAAYAGQHLYICKSTRDGRAFTEVHPLEGDGRVKELARIISGDHVTQAALLNAGEMIAEARRKAEQSE